MMRSWLGTTTLGQKGQTRELVLFRETDIRQETKGETGCLLLTCVCRLNGDSPRGEHSKEYKERERTHDVLVVSYVSSYDVSRNPTVTEGESIQSVKNNRHTQEDHVDVSNFLFPSTGV